MYVRVHEPRDDSPSPKVDDPRLWTRKAPNLIAQTDCLDSLPGNSDSFSCRPRSISREYFGTDQDKIGLTQQRHWCC